MMEDKDSIEFVDIKTRGLKERVDRVFTESFEGVDFVFVVTEWSVFISPVSLVRLNCERDNCVWVECFTYFRRVGVGELSDGMMDFVLGEVEDVDVRRLFFGVSGDIVGVLEEKLE